ncbi:hypothetical protein LTR78_004969 [Recurvomyces mirabilis]|uniref:NAD(P)-binding protein n=1 Tax=Recurvomyces mirabilis TaxID=574656 RepID=A0AAE0WNH6_9PEZI|nr:hypothetical protein LTR78_004969 [Recurvomyces mirabilis]KAK5158414.1 hypothetical protein LTS14_003433 [Recurvomyces mirabilis]
MAPFIFEVFWSRFNPPKDTTPSFAGKTLIITGANTGVGYEAALKFARLGTQRLILGVRSLKKGDNAKSRIEATLDQEGEKRQGTIEVWQLDMLSYSSLQAFVARVEKEVPRLDYLVLNAGIVMATHQMSDYGWEKTLQVNALSTTLLGLLLMPKLRASKTPEFTPVLEIIGSGSAYWPSKLLTSKSSGGILAAYNDPSNFDAANTYAVSKTFVEYIKTALVSLATNAQTGEPDVVIVSVCPGPTKSEVARDHTVWWIVFAIKMFRYLQRSGEEGARSYVSGLFLSQEGQGAFWQHDRIREPMPLLQGEEGAKHQEQVWEEIVEALKKDVPEVKDLV